MIPRRQVLFMKNIFMYKLVQLFHGRRIFFGTIISWTKNIFCTSWYNYFMVEEYFCTSWYNYFMVEEYFYVQVVTIISWLKNIFCTSWYNYFMVEEYFCTSWYNYFIVGEFFCVQVLYVQVSTFISWDVVTVDVYSLKTV